MQRCSERAWLRCPDRFLCGPVEDCTFTDDSECAAFNAQVECAVDPLAERPEMLKPGDPCPCCGQPIKTTDPIVLQLLTCIRDMAAPPSGSELEDDYGASVPSI